MSDQLSAHQSVTHERVNAIWRSGDELKDKMLGSLSAIILSKGSLTKYMQVVSGSEVGLRIISQVEEKVNDVDALMLGMAPSSSVICREVELSVRGVPWVYAKSLIPTEMIKALAIDLSNLDHNGLGGLLFSERGGERLSIELAKLGQNHHGFEALKHYQYNDELLWGRRSLFGLSGFRLLINEVFLPDLVASISS